MDRRLAAILAADVVGYSRQMEADEAATIGRLRALRHDIIDPAMAEHGGRIFKTTGDGLLAAFPSAVNALRCALAIQQSVRDAPPGLQLRIGLHQGDVVTEGDDLLGDGVNIAARLEPLAEPGGIALSARIREDAAGKISLDVEDLGTPELKNISQPIRVFRVRAAAGDRPTAEGPALALPDKPSLAVLPFQNMSGDPEQEYFADGVVEDIITALSRTGWLFVIARNSSFAYKGKSPDIRTVGRELGVRYVLEGSMRKSANRVRITCQLIDTATAGHIWADRFEGELADIFDLQDRITENVVGAIEPSLRRAEIVRAQGKSTENLDAYDLYLRALPQFYAATKPSLVTATTLLRQALALAPDYVRAKALLAYVCCLRVDLRWDELGDREAAILLAREVIATGTDDPDALRNASFVLSYTLGDFPAAFTALHRALRLHPNSAQGLYTLGIVHCHANQPDPAIDYIQRAMRLSPLDPEVGSMLYGLGVAHALAGRNAEALACLQRAVEESPNLLPIHRNLIFVLVRLGRLDEARAAAQRVLAMRPELHARPRSTAFYSPEYFDERTKALIAAGIPE